MIFDKYIDNPSGGASVVTNRIMYKDMYKNKFNAVLVRERGNIKYTLYKDNDKYDSHYVHFKIPSEVIPDFYYDTVIQFYTDDNAVKNEASLRRYYVKFYSNDPAFVYTFAHSFVKNKIFITDLEKKMSKEAIKNIAKMKNPKDDVWYVKSLYFAYLAVEKYNLFNKTYYNLNGKKYNKKELLDNIEQAEVKVQKRQDAESQLKKDKEEQTKKPSKLPPRNQGISTKTSKVVKTSKVSKVSKISPTTKTSKRSSIITNRNNKK